MLLLLSTILIFIGLVAVLVQFYSACELPDIPDWDELNLETDQHNNA